MKPQKKSIIGYTFAKNGKYPVPELIFTNVPVHFIDINDPI